MQKPKTYNTLFIAFVAFIATIWGYQFGGFDHLEHLPLLFRTEDPSYLANDSFLNANEGAFDPRYYFSCLIILITKVIPLSLTYFLLTFLCNFAIGWASYSAAQHFFNDNPWSGRIAAILAMTVRTVDLGSTAEVHAGYLTPNIMAFALVLLAIVWAIRERWLLVGLLLGLSSLLHPLVGPECGLMLFGFSGLQLIAIHRQKIRKYLPFGLGLMLFLALAAFNLIPYFYGQGEHIDDKTFFDIYAKLRNPHHILPSRFLINEEPKNGIYLLLLFGASMIGWIQTQKSQPSHFALSKQAWNVAFWAIALLLLAAIGYYFVEVKFIRLVATAQTFRLLYLFKWFTLILAGGLIGKHLSDSGHRNQIYAWAALASSFMLPNLFRIFVVWGFFSLLHRRLKLPQRLSDTVFIVEMLITLSLGFYGLFKAWETTQWHADFYPWLGILILVVLLAKIPNSTYFQYTAWLLTAVCLLIYWTQTPRREGMLPLQQAISRQYSLADLNPALLELSDKIDKLTAADAILVAPPILGELRYTAHRALVVSFKTYPFKGKGMIEWRERMFDCYGWTDMEGFNAVLWSFEPQYSVISPEKLKMIAQKYGATYAVLYTKTETTFPVLFENELYKLVYIGD